MIIRLLKRLLKLNETIGEIVEERDIINEK